MPLSLFDRVQETTTVTGAGTATLLGAITGYQSFGNIVPSGNTTYYCIADQSGSNWEVGIGTYTFSGNTLARTTILSSSNSDLAVTFTAGVKNVFITFPASKLPSGVNTGDETTATIKSKLSISTLSGSNTGDQVLPIASSTAPAPLGTAAVGTGTTFAREDHVHLQPSLATLGAQVAGTYATGSGSASGANTGDETTATIKTKLGVTTLSGSNTGDQVLPTTLPASDVYAWAKAATKPTYTYTEVGAQVAGTYATGSGTASGTNTGDQTNISGNAATATSAATLNGTSASQTGDGWWRSTGATGWYSATYSVGIYATEAGNVRTYNGASFIAGGNVTAYSDERVKKNWRPLAYNFLERLATIKSGVYDRTDIELTQVGVSAQSLQKLLPEAIHIHGDGELSVAYGNAALVSCVELAKELIELRKEITILKKVLK